MPMVAQLGLDYRQSHWRFTVSAAFVLGDHLGFTAGVEREMIFPMIVGKLVGGVTAVILAMLFVGRLSEEEK